MDTHSSQGIAEAPSGISEYLYYGVYFFCHNYIH